MGFPFHRLDLPPSPTGRLAATVKTHNKKEMLIMNRARSASGLITAMLSTAMLGTMLAGCDNPIPSEAGADAMGFSAPTAYTIEHNRAVAKALNLTDGQLQDHADWKEAEKGLIARDDSLLVKTENGTEVWNYPSYHFLQGGAPDSVNPSLWRQAQLNNLAGLYRVAEGIYQLRGYDLANLTLIEGRSGWIVVDPLTARETAAAAIEFAWQHLPKKPLVAIIFAHSHVDHFGGVDGLFDQMEPEGLRVIAPSGFMEEATSENIIAGMAMGRRAEYMFGKSLPRNARGHVGTGLGIAPAFGSVSILEPTEIIDSTPQNKIIDGVEFVFQNAPGSEAPAELTFYLPSLKAVCGAEVVSRTLHNLYTLRGAKVRDALKWSAYIDEMITLYDDAEIFFGTHHWPIWGNQAIVNTMKIHRDTYRYIHDQTVRLFNSGFTAQEIAEQIELPESLRGGFTNRDYYGTVRHNAKAVYQYYLGWYDANPANLNPLPPEESAARYVDMMGGAAAVLEKAQQYFTRGEYRWVAQVLNHVVFAHPNNPSAKALLAKTYDQLGYQAESGPWRDAYLSAALELRHGPSKQGVQIQLAKGLLQKTPVLEFFKSMAMRLNGPKAQGQDMSVKVVFSDTGETVLLRLENAVLHYKLAKEEDTADVTLRVSHRLFLSMVLKEVGIKDTLFSDQLSVEGSVLDLVQFFLLFDEPNAGFNIVTP